GLVVRDPGGPGGGLFARDAGGRPLCWATPEGGEPGLHPADATGIAPAAAGELPPPGGRRAVPGIPLAAEPSRDPGCAPDAAGGPCGVPAATIRRVAREPAEAAFESNLRLPVAWTDAWGRRHEEMVGRPVSLHAMRGISAHSNG